jgi:hypothetical protein
VTAPTGAAREPAPLDIAEWSFFWVGVKRCGTVINGKHMYVDYQIPASVRRPYPIVWCMVAAARARIGCALPTAAPAGPRCCLQEGYKVYVVDRPGPLAHPIIPDALGSIGPLLTFDTVTGAFKHAVNHPHRTWIGTGNAVDPLVDHFRAPAG